MRYLGISFIFNATGRLTIRLIALARQQIHAINAPDNQPPAATAISKAINLSCTLAALLSSCNSLAFGLASVLIGFVLELAMNLNQTGCQHHEPHN